MNTSLAQSSLLPFKFDFVLYGIGAVVLLVFGVLVISFGMIYIRALFSGAKVTITELIALAPAANSGRLDRGRPHHRREVRAAGLD